MDQSVTYCFIPHQVLCTAGLLAENSPPDSLFAYKKERVAGGTSHFITSTSCTFMACCCFIVNIFVQLFASFFLFCQDV